MIEKYKGGFLADSLLSSYNLVVSIKIKDSGKKEIVRAQVKAVSGNSLGFTGGTRGGKDREYKSGVKAYVQSTKTSDVVIGIQQVANGHFGLYFVPTILIEKLGQKSKSLKKIQALKNNWAVLENCKNYDYILGKCKEYGILKDKKKNL